MKVALLPFRAFAAFVCAFVLLTAQLPVMAETDLASSIANHTVSGLTGSVTIRNGGVPLTISNGMVITPAQAAALQQALSGGRQGLVLSPQGAATGGSVNLSGAQSQNFTIPSGVTAIHDFAKSGALNVAGNFYNAGTFYAISTSSAVTNALVSANNILNSGLLTTVLPAGGLAGYTGALADLNLTLSAGDTIANSGIISSAGALNLVAGKEVVNGNSVRQAVMSAVQNVNIQSGNVANSGLIQSINQDVVLQAQAGQPLLIDNVGGAIRASVGTIFVDNAFAGKGTSTILEGGILDSTRVFADAGRGELQLNVNQLSGVLDINAGTAYSGASGSALKLGDINITGDPTFYTIGDMTLTGNITVAEKLTLLATGNIDLGGHTITARSVMPGPDFQGHDITIIAGASLLPSAGAAGSSDATDQIAPGTTVKVLGPSTSGGSIMCLGCEINTSSFDGTGAPLDKPRSGGNVLLVAYRSLTHPLTGNIELKESLIDANGDTGGVKSGNITVIAPGVIELADISQGGNEIGTLLVINAEPKGTLTADSTGRTIGTIAPGVLSANGVIKLNGTIGGTANNLTFKAGELLTMDPSAIVFAHGTYFGTKGGTITLTSGNHIELAGIISVEGAVGSLAAEIEPGRVGGNGGNSGNAGTVVVTAKSSITSVGTLSILANGGERNSVDDPDGAPEGGEGAHSFGEGPTKINGFAGGNGGRGGNGGIVTITAPIITLEHGGAISASGVNGGNGGLGGSAGEFNGRGGNGGNGGAGGAGGNGGVITINGSAISISTTIVASGGAGGAGGAPAGGDLAQSTSGSGGRGGAGGAGGAGGTIKINSKDGSLTLLDHLDVDGGRGGNASAGGDGGESFGGTAGIGGAGGVGGVGGRAGSINISVTGLTGPKTVTLGAAGDALLAVGGDGGNGGNGGAGGKGQLVGGNGGNGGNAGVSGAAGTIKITADSILQNSTAQILAIGMSGGAGGDGGAGGLSTQGKGGNGGHGGNGSAPGLGGRIDLVALVGTIELNALVATSGGFFGGVSGNGGDGGDGLNRGGNGGNAGRAGGGSNGGIVNVTAPGKVTVALMDAGGSYGANFSTIDSGRGGDGGSISAQVGIGGNGGNGALPQVGGAGGQINVVSKYSDITVVNPAVVGLSTQLAVNGGAGSTVKGRGGDGANAGSLGGTGGRGGNAAVGGAGGKAGTIKLEAKSGSVLTGANVQIALQGGFGGYGVGVKDVDQNAFGGKGGDGNFTGAGGNSGQGGNAGAGGVLRIYAATLIEIPFTSVAGGVGGGGLFRGGNAGQHMGTTGGNGSVGGVVLPTGIGGKAGNIELQVSKGSVSVLGAVSANGGDGGSLAKDAPNGLNSRGGDGGGSVFNGGNGGAVGITGKGGDAGQILINVINGSIFSTIADARYDYLSAMGGNGGASTAIAGDGGVGEGNGGNGGKLFGTGNGGNGGVITLKTSGTINGNMNLGAVLLRGGNGGIGIGYLNTPEGEFINGGGAGIGGNGSRGGGSGGSVDGVGSGGNGGRLTAQGTIGAITFNNFIDVSGGVAGGKLTDAPVPSGLFLMVPGIGGTGGLSGAKGGDAGTSLRPGNGGNGGSVFVSTGSEITLLSSILAHGGNGATPVMAGAEGGNTGFGRAGNGGNGGKGGNGGLGGSIVLESKNGSIVSAVSAPEPEQPLPHSLVAAGGIGGLGSSGGNGGAAAEAGSFGGNGGAAGSAGGGAKGGVIRVVAAKGTITMNGDIVADGGRSPIIDPVYVKAGNGGSALNGGRGGNGGRGASSGNNGNGGTITMIASSPVVSPVPTVKGYTATSGTPGGQPGAPGGSFGLPGTTGTSGKDGTVFRTSDASEFADDEFLTRKKKRTAKAPATRESNHLRPVAFITSASSAKANMHAYDLFIAKTDTFAKFGPAALGLSKGAALLGFSRGDSITLMCLHEDGGASVKIRYGSGKITLRSGEQVTLTPDMVADPGSLQIHVATRNAHTYDCGVGNAVVSEFSIPSAVMLYPQLKAMQTSADSAERNLYSKMIKTAAALQVATASRGVYKTAHRSTAAR